MRLYAEDVELIQVRAAELGYAWQTWLRNLVRDALRRKDQKVV